jgi:hypothetical protein
MTAEWTTPYGSLAKRQHHAEKGRLSDVSARNPTAVGAASSLLSAVCGLLAKACYASGPDSYLDEAIAQPTLLTNRQTAMNLRMEQMAASVQLVKASGGGWDATTCRLRAVRFVLAPATIGRYKFLSIVRFTSSLLRAFYYRNTPDYDRF